VRFPLFSVVSFILFVCICIRVFVLVLHQAIQPLSQHFNK
jgi:hypothetical protein